MFGFKSAKQKQQEKLQALFTEISTMFPTNGKIDIREFETGVSTYASLMKLPDLNKCADDLSKKMVESDFPPIVRDSLLTEVHSLLMSCHISAFLNARKMSHENLTACYRFAPFLLSPNGPKEEITALDKKWEAVYPAYTKILNRPFTPDMEIFEYVLNDVFCFSLFTKTIRNREFSLELRSIWGVHESIVRAKLKHLENNSQ
jgi:hypothetical protein